MTLSAEPLAGTSLILSVAIPRPLQGLFTYKLPAHLSSHVKVGGWVKVPFRRSVTHAFVVEPPRPLSELSSGISIEKLKDVLDVGLSESVFPADVWDLCRWAHDYYFAPLGEVLNCAAPATLLELGGALKRKSKALPANVPLIPGHVLTDEQLRAFHYLNKLRMEGGGRVALLKGVTGSGKTEVYIELAKKALAEGRGVLILVPEIALTPQLHDRFESGLGAPVALWHSAVSKGRRLMHGMALRRGEVKVVVGARSAVFAPLLNLGLIVVDEEHDPTFKQEDRVRYHARDLAVVRAKLTNSFVVLGSATPSFETRERVREGRYSLSTLDQRIAPGGLPRIEYVDLRTEAKLEKTQAPLAVKTIQAIQEAITSGDQVIVYLNRRGFAAFLLCKDCGNVTECPQCSISLTVYRRSSDLRCHLCGHREATPDVCKKCQGIELQEMGAGTESLENELPQLLEGAKILRLDRDQITSATRLSEILSSFRKGEANILLGTQMLVKGHDFPGVTLVVVILADSLFHWPDFRAHERALQILKQVSGRAGRGEKAGRVLIQTYKSDHPVLNALQNDLSEQSFLEEERELRMALGYPPFGRLARIRFENPSREEASDRAVKVAHRLRTVLVSELDPAKFADSRLQLLGPSEAFLKRVKGIYRWDLILKAKNVENLQKALRVAREYCGQNKWQFVADIDPYGI